MQFQGFGFFFPKRSRGSEMRPMRPHNPLNPMSDQDRTSPYNINIISRRRVMGTKKNINYGIII